MKTLLATIGIVGALVLGFLGFNKESKTEVITNTVKGSYTEILSPYISFNGILHWYSNGGFTAATTTVCAVQSPAATSTLVSASVVLNVSSTTATTVTLAKAASAFATTTILSNQAVSANAQATIVASSSPVLTTGAINDLVFAPSQWFVVSMAGGIGTFSPSGTCRTEFAQLQ